MASRLFRCYPVGAFGKNFARVFKEYNLVEYKSPDDNLSVSDFSKFYGYACLYAALNNAPITRLTFTFIISCSPCGLIRRLADGLDTETTCTILKKGSKKGKGAPVRAYLAVILRANSDAVLEESGLTAKYETKGETEGAEKARAEIARNLLNMGWAVEQTAQIFRLPVEKVQDLYADMQAGE
jgi:hypothetical protein